MPVIFSNFINGFSGFALQEAYYIAMFYVFNTAIAVGAFVCFDQDVKNNRKRVDEIEDSKGAFNATGQSLINDLAKLKNEMSLSLDESELSLSRSIVKKPDRFY